MSAYPLIDQMIDNNPGVTWDMWKVHDKVKVLSAQEHQYFETKMTGDTAVALAEPEAAIATADTEADEPVAETAPQTVPADEPIVPEADERDARIAELEDQLSRTEKSFAGYIDEASEKISAAKLREDDTYLELVAAKAGKRKGKLRPEEVARAAEIERRKRDELAQAEQDALKEKLQGFVYPTFPTWVMKGTSLFEGFVKPYCEVNSRIDYFMWVAGATVMLNYLGSKVRVEMKDWSPSLHVYMIGRRGSTKKSSSIKDAMKFFEFAGMLKMHSQDVKSADGMCLVMEGGSAEGVGTRMMKTNCKNAIWFYDEMKKLVDKATIQGSSIKDALLKTYESNSFSNGIKSSKDSFTIAPNSYTASLITATTPRVFAKLWGLLADGADGLESRATFILEPETLPQPTPQAVVSFLEAAKVTRTLVDKAVNQGVYKFFDQTPLRTFLNEEVGDDDRVEIRAEKWALYFAIDLGLDEIDEECVDRGIAMARYEMATKKYLMTMEAQSEMAALQQDIVRKLMYRGGKMRESQLKAACDAKRYDTHFWWKAFSGLMGAGNITTLEVVGKPKEVVLVRGFDDLDDEDEE